MLQKDTVIEDNRSKFFTDHTDPMIIIDDTKGHRHNESF